MTHLALILGFARKVSYIVTIATGLGVWAVAEGFGEAVHRDLD